MKNLFLAIPIALILLLASCAENMREQISQLEAGYITTVDLLIAGRKPCVDSTAVGECLIDDDMYRKISVFITKIDSALDKAKHFEVNNQEDASKPWIDVIIKNLGKLNQLMAPIKELL